MLSVAWVAALTELACKGKVESIQVLEGTVAAWAGAFRQERQIGPNKAVTIVNHYQGKKRPIYLPE